MSATRYELFGEIASGGMGAVYLARAHGAVGFSRLVAIKRLHRQYAADPEVVASFIDEARLAARVIHPNVVPILDVVARDGELLMVMEFVRGDPLSALFRRAKRRGERIPVGVVAAVVAATLHGLHAAHEAVDVDGAPLGIVHRDVSPENVLVSADGVARVVDFGVAKAARRLHQTRDGQVKGKLPYMAPEQLRGQPITRQADVYGAAVVLWECLTGTWLFDGENEAAILAKILEGEVRAPSSVADGIPEALDAVVLRGLSSHPSVRFATAHEMATALEASVTLATTSEVGAWVTANAAETLAERHAQIARAESGAARPDPDQRAILAVLRPEEDAGVDGLSATTEPTSRRAVIASRSLAVLAGGVAISLAGLVATRLGPEPSPGARASTEERDAHRERAVFEPAPTTPPHDGTEAPPRARPSASASAEPAPSAPPAPAARSGSPTTAGSARSPRAVGTTRASSGTSSPPRPDCAVPYTVDPEGVHRYLPECMNR